CRNFLLQPFVLRNALADRFEREGRAAHVGCKMLQREWGPTGIRRRTRSARRRVREKLPQRRVLHRLERLEELLRERPVSEVTSDVLIGNREIAPDQERGGPRA